MSQNRVNKKPFYYGLIGFFALFATFLFWKQNMWDDHITVEKQYADIDFLLRAIEKNNPYPYNNCLKSTIDSLKKEIEGSIKGPISSIEFYRKIRPLVSAFNDPHLSIFHPKLVSQKSGKKPKVFPYQIVIDENKIFIKNELSNQSAFLKGREIESINGISASAILSTLSKNISAPDVTYKLAAIEEDFPLFFWRAYGTYDIYKIKLKGESIISHNGISLQVIDSIYNNIPPFYYREIKNEHTGILKITSFDINQRAPFNTFLRSTFFNLSKNSDTNLIIDIRDNPGGSTLLVRDLFNYITTKPYSMSWQEVYFENGKKINGSIDTATTLPENNIYKFKGNVFLLTNALTGSSAHMMASTFKYYKIGKTIGHSSFSSQISGEVNKFILPNSKLIMYCPTAFFILPYALNKTSTLTPDHLIRESLSDKLNSEDVFVNYCKTILKK